MRVHNPDFLKTKLAPPNRFVLKVVITTKSWNRLVCLFLINYPQKEVNYTGHADAQGMRKMPKHARLFSSPSYRQLDVITAGSIVAHEPVAPNFKAGHSGKMSAQMNCKVPAMFVPEQSGTRCEIDARQHEQKLPLYIKYQKFGNFSHPLCIFLWYLLLFPDML